MVVVTVISPIGGAAVGIVPVVDIDEFGSMVLKMAIVIDKLNAPDANSLVMGCDHVKNKEYVSPASDCIGLAG